MAPTLIPTLPESSATTVPPGSGSAEMPALDKFDRFGYTSKQNTGAAKKEKKMAKQAEVHRLKEQQQLRIDQAHEDHMKEHMREHQREQHMLLRIDQAHKARMKEHQREQDKRQEGQKGNRPLMPPRRAITRPAAQHRGGRRRGGGRQEGRGGRGGKGGRVGN